MAVVLSVWLLSAAAASAQGPASLAFVQPPTSGATTWTITEITSNTNAALTQSGPAIAQGAIGPYGATAIRNDEPAKTAVRVLLLNPLAGLLRECAPTEK